MGKHPQMALEQTQGFVPGFLPLMNLRELGGIEAADGRRVRHGLFYRGSTLCNLNADQREIVDGFNLRYIIDLRAKSEAAGKDNYVPEDAIYRRIPGMFDVDGSEMDFSPAAIQRMLESGKDPLAFMRELYVSMAHGNPAMHALVDCLLEDNVPLYFHCGAGKDRTGVAAAIILTILGADDEAIIENFLLTNLYRAELIENPPAELPPLIDSPETWSCANAVDADDLRAVLAAMDGGVSSREEYLEKEYGLNAATLEQLRSRYLE